MHGNGLALLTAACGLALGCAPTAAHADVRITPQTISVSTDAVTAVIDRKPLGLRFLDAAGRPFLRQVDQRSGGRPFVAFDPQILGSEYLRGPSHYAPFQYEVGSERRSQFTSGNWTGNLIAGERAGRFHGAREVISAHPDGDGVRLELSTTEGGFRRLIVRIGPDPASPSSLRVQAEARPRGTVISLGDSFKSTADEQFYGFGGQHNAQSQRGHIFRSWTDAQNYGPGVLTPLTTALLPKIGNTYMFPNGPNATYYSQSLFVSSRGYGFSVAHDNLVRWRMAADRPDVWQTSATGNTLDYTVAPGGPAQAASRLTQINGRHRLPPQWAQGPTISRTHRLFRDTPVTYARRVLDDLEQIEARNTPISAYIFEGSRNLPGPFVADVIARLKARGIRAVLYLRGYAAKYNPNRLTDYPGVFDQAIANGYGPTRPDGTPYTFASGYGSRAVMIDYTNPRTVAWWNGRVKALLDTGADGFMLDFGEQVTDGMRFADGTTGATMHQRFPALMTKVTRAATDAYVAANPGREVFFFNRAGASGRPGSAAYEEANFSGDGTTDWSQAAGLKAQTTDMLNRAIGGAYGFNTDIGGYSDYVTPRTTRELYTRWAQWAVFTPYFRSHNSSLQGVRMPWSFGEGTYTDWLNAAALHNRAVTLIRQQWQGALAGGPPPLRPLWMAAPGEPGAAAEGQAWMVGDDLLAAPVVDRGAVTKSVYLPAGCWNYAPNGQQYTGGQRVTVPAPITVVPYFTRCGTNPLPGS